NRKLYACLKALLRLLILSRFQWGKDRDFNLPLPNIFNIIFTLECLLWVTLDYKILVYLSLNDYP
ncbi:MULTISPECIES: hypothetical protein, partial [unclassified Chryseobacterium]|uniref:hypothetical protein n=1 Tax=unclassified Chryseobacterium TaxID=2593645 RepID=UPI001E594925